MRQQLRQISGDTAIYGVTTIVQRFLSFLLTPFYTHYLTQYEFGVQTYLFLIIAFLLVFANFGMESAFFKYDSTAESDSEKRKVYWNAITINWGAAIILGGILILFPEAINSFTVELPEDQLYLIRMTGVILALDSMSMVTLGLLRMRRKAKTFGGIKIAAIVVNIGLNIWLVSGLHMKLEGIFTAGVVQSLVQFGLTIPFVIKMLPFELDSRLRSMMLRFGLPTIGSGIALIGLQLIDRPIIKELLGLDGLGLYQANYKLAIAMVVFVGMFDFAWRPFFLQQASKENARPLFARIFTYFNVVSVGIFLGVSLFIVHIAAFPIPLRDGTTFIAKEYWEGLPIVSIALIAYIFNGWYTNFVAGVYIEKKTHALPWITGIAAIAEGILCYLLIPALGIMGGAVATLCAYAIMGLSLFFYIRRYYPIPYEWSRIAKIGIGAAAIYVANLLLFDFYDRSLTTTIYRFGLLLLFPVWLIVVRFFNRSELREIGNILGKLRRG